MAVGVLPEFEPVGVAVGAAAKASIPLTNGVTPNAVAPALMPITLMKLRLFMVWLFTSFET